MVLHSYISIGGSIWGGIDSIRICLKMVNSIRIGRKMVNSIDDVFRSIGTVLWFCCIWGTSSPLRERFIRKKHQKLKRILIDNEMISRQDFSWQSCHHLNHIILQIWSSVYMRHNYHHHSHMIKLLNHCKMINYTNRGVGRGCQFFSCKSSPEK